ncbi:MAG: S1 RNA-binding domain-containing protein, partial [Clostridia bacterium]|nr:S1 RNA-binding domain-containing protein [Clostridia bacterium]
SKISEKRIEKVEDVLKIGDTVKVKVYEIDDQGRINLTAKNID